MLYHAARRSARASIAAGGLQARDPQVAGNLPAVYAFTDARWCPWHAKWYREAFDVWAIDATDLPVVADTTHEAMGGVAILADVPAERCTFVQALPERP